MLQTGSDELGVFTNGCSISGSVTMMTRYQVAQTWASLPWPDDYTPAKTQAAYRVIFDGMLDRVAQYRNKWSKQIAITQTMDGSEGYDWPRVDANGVEGTTDPNTVAPLADPSCFNTMLTLANQSSGGAIGTTTVLDPRGPGINPPSPFTNKGPLLKWIEAKAIDGLPFDNGPHGPIRGPLYGCYYGVNDFTNGPDCPP